MSVVQMSFDNLTLSPYSQEKLVVSGDVFGVTYRIIKRSDFDFYMKTDVLFI